MRPAIGRHNTRRKSPHRVNVAIFDTPSPYKGDWFQIVHNPRFFAQFLPPKSNTATNKPKNDTVPCTESVGFRLLSRGKQKAE